MTVAQARVWLWRRLDKGERCPTCGQLAKRYRRKILDTMARDLMRAHSRAGLDPFHAPSLLGHNDGSFAKLAYWGLIVELPSERDDGGKHGGRWQITLRGRAFVRRQIRVPKYVRTYDGQLVGVDDGEDDPTVDIVECLGTRFDYGELMRGA